MEELHAHPPMEQHDGEVQVVILRLVQQAGLIAMEHGRIVPPHHELVEREINLERSLVIMTVVIVLRLPLKPVLKHVHHVLQVHDIEVTAIFDHHLIQVGVLIVIVDEDRADDGTGPVADQELVMMEPGRL